MEPELLSALQDKPHKESKRASMFKSVFLVGNGPWVLARILEDLKFLEICHNMEDTALSNYAKELVTTVFQTKGKADAKGIINFIKTKLRRIK